MPSSKNPDSDPYKVFLVPEPLERIFPAIMVEEKIETTEQILTREQLKAEADSLIQTAIAENNRQGYIIDFYAIDEENIIDQYGFINKLQRIQLDQLCEKFKFLDLTDYNPARDAELQSAMDDLECDQTKDNFFSLYKAFKKAIRIVQGRIDGIASKMDSTPIFDVTPLPEEQIKPPHAINTNSLQNSSPAEKKEQEQEQEFPTWLLEKLAKVNEKMKMLSPELGENYSTSPTFAPLSLELAKEMESRKQAEKAIDQLKMPEDVKSDLKLYLQKGDIARLNDFSTRLLPFLVKYSQFPHPVPWISHKHINLDTRDKEDQTVFAGFDVQFHNGKTITVQPENYDTLLDDLTKECEYIKMKDNILILLEQIEDKGKLHTEFENFTQETEKFMSDKYNQYALLFHPYPYPYPVHAGPTIEEIKAQAQEAYEREQREKRIQQERQAALEPFRKKLDTLRLNVIALLFQRFGAEETGLIAKDEYKKLDDQCEAIKKFLDNYPYPINECRLKTDVQPLFDALHTFREEQAMAIQLIAFYKDVERITKEIAMLYPARKRDKILQDYNNTQKTLETPEQKAAFLKQLRIDRQNKKEEKPVSDFTELYDQANDLIEEICTPTPEKISLAQKKEKYVANLNQCTSTTELLDYITRLTNLKDRYLSSPTLGTPGKNGKFAVNSSSSTAKKPLETEMQALTVQMHTPGKQ